jgi:superfamily I DNA/RNA helicase
VSDPEPNDQQRRLIENTEGIYLVDAGAGTGKTFAVTRRYATIVDQPGVEPEDVLLVTFTRSAATEMKERIVDRSSYSLRELADAPIRTFHSHCHAILEEHGYRVPTHLGIDDRITNSTRLIEEDLVEGALFREFIGGFRDGHPEYADQFRAIEDPQELLTLIKQLSAKGIVPTTDGWYGRRIAARRRVRGVSGAVRRRQSPPERRPETVRTPERAGPVRNRQDVSARRPLEDRPPGSSRHETTRRFGGPTSLRGGPGSADGVRPRRLRRVSRVRARPERPELRVPPAFRVRPAL